MTSGSFTGGRLRCVFTREIAASDAAEDRNLNESAFLLLAIGAGRGKQIERFSMSIVGSTGCEYICMR